MRTIKFRCWFNGAMWHGIPEINFDQHGVREVKLNSDDSDFDSCADTWTGNDDFDLMQYTGMKDKLGNDIYEGDILKISYHQRKSSVIDDMSDYGHYIGAVNFTPSAGFGLKKTRRYSEIEDKYFNHGRLGFITQSASNVVGNIYETPELLK